MADFLTDPETALMFAPGDRHGCADALERAADLEDDERKAMSDACRALALSEFDHRDEARRYAEILSATSRPPGASRRSGRRRSGVILYYAAGGGLGHLTRATALLGRLEPGRPAALLTASPFARDPRVTAGFPSWRSRELEADLPAYRAWLDALLASGDYDAMYVDSFPGGILGELCGLAALGEADAAPRCSAPQVGRVRAAPPGALPRYERTYVLEPLEQPHADALAGCSRRSRR